MYKSYFSYRLLPISIFILLIFSTISCEVSVKPGSPPPNEEEVKKISSKLPPPSFPESINSNILADYNWSATDLKGKTIKADDWKNKVVVLNMWATWCGPCVAEMPSLQSLYEKTKDDGVVFVLISNEDQTTVSEFIQKRNFSLPIYTISENLPSVFTSDAIPATFIISPNGKVVFDHLGAANWDNEAVIKFLKTVSQLK